MQVKDFKTAHLHSTDVLIRPARYQDTKNLALEIFDSETGEPLCTATINPPDSNDKTGRKSLKLGPGQIAVKNYGENEGMVEALKAAGIIEGKPVRLVSSGYISIPVYNLTERAKAEFGVGPLFP